MVMVVVMGHVQVVLGAVATHQTHRGALKTYTYLCP
jgi:hypothetical protein